MFGQPDVASRSHRSSNLCDGASADVSGNRSGGAGSNAEVTRAAGAASPLGKLGGAVALLFGCPVRCRSFVVWETGWESGARAGTPCSEVGADVSGNRNGGGGFMARRPCRRRHICPGQLGPMCRWKYGRPRSAVWAIARATARSNGLHGFGVHEWSPLYCLGNRVMERASQIRETEFCEGVRSRGQPRGCTWWRTGSTCGQPDVRGVRTTNS